MPHCNTGAIVAKSAGKRGVIPGSMLHRTQDPQDCRHFRYINGYEVGDRAGWCFWCGQDMRRPVDVMGHRVHRKCVRAVLIHYG